MCNIPFGILAGQFCPSPPDDPVIFVRHFSWQVISEEQDFAARQYRGMALLELARESLGNAGVNTRGLSRDEVATRALHSTSDFPEILSAVTNKTLRQAYEAYPRTFMLFCRQVLATDFKAMNRVQLGEAPQLLEVGESGEFKRGTLGESKESYKVKTYGRVVAITRQVLINDDLETCVKQMHETIQSQHFMSSNQKDFIEQMKKSLEK